MLLRKTARLLHNGLQLAQDVHRIGKQKRFDLDALSLVLQKTANQVYQRHPNAIERLQPIAGTRFYVTITNLPINVLMVFNNNRIQVDCNLRYLPEADVAITGSYQALVQIFEGSSDADSLFFSRDINIKGNIEALVTLRNALDNEEIDLVAELSPKFGSYSGIIQELIYLTNQRLLKLEDGNHYATTQPQ